jgi:hypothetical protein
MVNVHHLLNHALTDLEIVASNTLISRQSGWIALPRDIEKYWIWADARRFKMWIHLVFNAKWEDSMVIIGNSQVTLKRGQLAVSTRELMRQWGCCCEMATAFLKNLEISGMIEREISTKYSIITIVDFDMYQPATGVLPMATAKPKAQPKAIREAVQNKEIKKENNNKNIIVFYSKEQEDKFFHEVIANEGIIQSLAVVLQLKPMEVKDALYVFLNDIRLREVGHSDKNDFVTHFKHWYGKKEKGGGGAASKKVNYEANKQQSARRGTEISNKPNKDYKNDAF